jgi:hypothetical protein
MSRTLRFLQWVGLALLAISACLPAFPFRLESPGLAPHLQPGEAAIVMIGPPGAVRVPADDIVSGMTNWVFEGEPPAAALWALRPMYAYALLPIWCLALVLARATRRGAGAALWVVTGALIVLEASYLSSDYLSFAPGGFGRFEMAFVWCVVVATLVYRRRVDRRLDAVGATVGSQALLGLMHGWTLPSTYARDLFFNVPFGTLVERVVAVFAPGFWIGMAGLALVALPGYVGPRRYEPAVTASGSRE